MPVIKNIIFDLGEVLIELFPERTINAFATLFGIAPAAVPQLNGILPVFQDFETGRISLAAFKAYVRSELGFEFEDDAFHQAWWAILGDIPPEKMELVKKLGEDYRVFCLSNTNELHLAYIHKYVHEKYQLENLDVLFEKAYYSNDIKMRKPDKEIYQYVLTDSNMVAKETLFIDDSKENIVSAQQMGINTIYLPDRTKLIAELEAYLA